VSTLAVIGLLVGLPLLLHLLPRRRRRWGRLVIPTTAAHMLPQGGHAVSTSDVTGLLPLLLQLLQLPWRRWWRRLRLLVAEATTV
jgi:hypothetical protein